jgi:hypothetical protein
MTTPMHFRILMGACAAAGLLACSSPKTANFGSAQNILSYGVYSSQIADGSGMAVKISLNPNNTYSKKKFQGPCLLTENKGDWKSTNEIIEFHLQETRSRNDCGTEEWQVEKTNKTAERMIRNVTTNSFEILDQEEQTSAEWQKFVKR